MEQCAKAAVLGQRLSAVPLGEMDAYEDAVCALAQRLGRRHGKRRLDRLTETVERDQPLTQTLQRVDTQLPEALPFVREPIVIPIGEQVVA